ncbi:MAG: exosortase-associated EpsI family protein [Verrucomicrobiota bacterium]
MFAALSGATMGLCALFPNAVMSPESGVEMKLPDNIKGYVGVEREPSLEELRWLPADTQILKRVYYPRDVYSEEEAIMGSLWATLILSGNDSRSLHRPEICLDGQGWEIDGQAFHSLELAGTSLEVKVLTLKGQPRANGQGHLRAHYVYWWVGHDLSTARTRDRKIISALDNVFRNVNHRWGYPSVMVYFEEGSSNEREQALKRALDFIQSHAPVFQKSLRSDLSLAETKGL